MTVTSSVLIDNHTTCEGGLKIYLQGHSIAGNGCTPISVSYLTPATPALYIDNGSLVGNSNHPCLTNSTNASIYLNSVDTVGGFVSSSYVSIQNGNHTSCSFDGPRYHLDSSNSNSIYDCDLSSFVNPYRNAIENNGNGTYRLRRVTAAEQTTNGWNKVCNAFLEDEKYDSITNFVTYDDSNGDFGVKLLADIIEDVDMTETFDVSKNIYIDPNGHTFSGDLLANGDVRLSAIGNVQTTGTFTFSQIDCRLLMCVNGIKTVTITSGTVTTLYTQFSNTTINGGTFGSVVSGTNGNLIINAGTFNGSLTGSGGSISVRGGIYANEEVFNTFSPHIAEGYISTQNPGGTYSVIHA